VETRHAEVVACAPGREFVRENVAAAAAWAGREGTQAGRIPAMPLARRREPAHPAHAGTAAASGAGEMSLRDRLVRAMGAESYQRYFERAARLDLGPGGLQVSVPSRFMAELLGRRFGDVLRDVARAHTGADVEVSFRVDAEAPAERSSGASAGRRDRSISAPAPADPAPEAAPPVRARRRAIATPSSWYSLDDFVVGSSNRLAYEAAVRIAEDTGAAASKLSPLFIHGACGVGKTHLLQGIARRFKERNPGAVVRYITGEAFTNEFIAAVREGRAGVGGQGGGAGDRFRRAYRNVDLLCIDDVHFLANKQATQTELLHTFDAIGTGGARVVLASDGHPRQIRRFSDALVSRFLSGMVVRLEPPERALRERIIRLFADRRGLPIDDAGVRAIADHAEIAAVGAPGAPEVSVRELEGLVTRVEAVWRLLLQSGASNEATTSIGRIVVEQALGAAPGGEGGAPRRLPRPIRVDHIIATVCQALGIVGTDFAGRGRHPRVVLARAVVVVLARRLTTASFPEIARAMGRPNHSTVITAYQRLMKQIEAGEPCPLDGEFAGLTLAQFCDHFAAEVTRTA